MVLSGEVRGEQPQSGQMDLPGADRLEDRGELASGPSDRDPATGDVLRKPVSPNAERKKRGVPALEVELPMVDLAEAEKKLSLQSGAIVDQLLRRNEKLRRTEGLDRASTNDHASCVTRRIFSVIGHLTDASRERRTR